MTQTYALIDAANTFFRARHVASRNSDPEEKAAFALHLTLSSINQAVRLYNIDHVVVCLEGRSFRKAMYAPYKKNRIVDEKSQTEAEIEENRMFWQTYESLTDYFKDRTNITVLRHEEAEADDMIARFIALHPSDNHWIISTDQDYIQCLNERVHIFNGVEGHRISLDGYWKENGKPVIDKKTKRVIYQSAVRYNAPQEAKDHAEEYLKQKAKGIKEPKLPHVGTYKEESDCSDEKMDEAILQRLFKLYEVSEIPQEIMPMIINKLGNSSVATLPTLLDLITKNLLPPHSLNAGDAVVFASVGAGMNINAIAYRF
jgi:5'-3' exonuclease